MRRRLIYAFAKNSDITNAKPTLSIAKIGACIFDSYGYLKRGLSSTYKRKEGLF